MLNALQYTPDDGLQAVLDDARTQGYGPDTLMGHSACPDDLVPSLLMVMIERVTDHGLRLLPQVFPIAAYSDAWKQASHRCQATVYDAAEVKQGPHGTAATWPSSLLESLFAYNPYAGHPDKVKALLALGADLPERLDLATLIAFTVDRLSRNTRNLSVELGDVPAEYHHDTQVWLTTLLNQPGAATAVDATVWSRWADLMVRTADLQGARQLWDGVPVWRQPEGAVALSLWFGHALRHDHAASQVAFLVHHTPVLTLPHPTLAASWQTVLARAVPTPHGFELQGIEDFLNRRLSADGMAACRAHLRAHALAQQPSSTPARPRRRS